MKKLLLILGFTLGLAGCAGSPMQVTNMNSTQIKSVSNSDLCRTYSLKASMMNTYTVRNEVKRRGIDCGTPGSLKADNSAAMINALSNLANSGNSGNNFNSGMSRTKGFLQSSYQSGLNKICIYSTVLARKRYDWCSANLSFELLVIINKCLMKVYYSQANSSAKGSLKGLANLVRLASLLYLYNVISQPLCICASH